MRDEIDGRLWAAHHEPFADLIDRGAAAVRAGVRRLGLWDGSSQHLLALVASFAITALTFNTTAV